MKKAFENKKISLGLVTMALIFAVIIVSSFWPFVLDPTRITTTEFITDELIITAIVLSATVSMMFVAQAANASNPLSEVAKAKVEFKSSMEKIDNASRLFQWIRKILQPKDRLEIAKREMAKLLVPVDVFYFSEEEIKELVDKKKEINGKNYGPYSANKIRDVLKLKKRVMSIRFVSPNYYTSVKSIDSTRTTSELARNENSKKVATIIFNLLMRILLTWLGASILGSLVRDFAQEGGSTAQTWMTFLSRGFSFCSSCFLGYNIGCKLNDLDAFYILKRVEVHKMYLQDLSFISEEDSSNVNEREVRDDDQE